MTLTLLSWKVNELIDRAGRDEITPLLRHNPEIVCFQETKTAPLDIKRKPDTRHGYRAWFSPYCREGYCGVGMLTRIDPDAVSFTPTDPHVSGEGLLMTAEFRDFTLINTYVPKGDGKPVPVQGKLAFLDTLLKILANLREQARPVILCGHLNVAHTDLDLWNIGHGNPPRCGTTGDERLRLDRLTGMGFIDAFRLFSSLPNAFTWERSGRGMRLDYFFVSQDLRDCILDSAILNRVEGSGHRPISLELER